MQFYHYLAAVLLGTSIGASTGIIMSEQKTKADVNELVAFLTGALPQAIRNCLATTDDMKDCRYVGYPLSGGGYSNRKVELLSYGDIPDYYPQNITNRDLSKRQKISMLTDYEVVGLVPIRRDLLISAHPVFTELTQTKRRSALVLVELTPEAMYNCQSIIDKLRKQHNIEYIAFRSSYDPSDYPCKGTYSKDPEFHNERSRDMILSKQADNTANRLLVEILGGYARSPGYPPVSLFNSSFVFGKNKDGEPLWSISGAYEFPKNVILIIYNF